MQLPAETKKTGPRLEPKDAVTGHAAANTAQKPVGILKSQKENVPRYDSNDVHGSHSFTLFFDLTSNIAEHILHTHSRLFISILSSRKNVATKVSNG